MPKDKDIFIISIVTLFTILVWIVVDTAITYRKTEFTGVSQETLTPVSPDIKFEGAL